MSEIGEDEEEKKKAVVLKRKTGQPGNIKVCTEKPRTSQHNQKQNAQIGRAHV